MKTQNKKQVLFKKWLCDIRIERYADNNRKCIQLVDTKTGMLVATATANIPHVEMKDSEVAIKNYSENGGMLQALIGNGVVSKPNWFVSSCLVELPICEILI